MLELIGAGVLRDGGSISLDYRKNGDLVSVLLEVNRGDDTEPKSFGHLHVGREIQNRCDAATVVTKGSTVEAVLLADIEALQRCTPTGARPDTLRWLGEMRKHLSERTR